VGVALPELPDDRRAAPRRQPPADRQVSVRNRDALPPDWPDAEGAERPPAAGSEQFPPANGIPRPGGPGPISGPVNGGPVNGGPPGAGPVNGGPVNGGPVNGGPANATGRQRPPAPPANGSAPAPVEATGGGARAVPLSTRAATGHPRPDQPPARPAGRPPAPPPVNPGPPGADDPGTEPIGSDTWSTDKLPIEAPPARRPAASPGDPETTVVIGRAVAPPPEPVDEDAGPEGARISRRERREAGELGGKAGADYKKQHDELSRKVKKKPRSGRRRRPAFWRELPLLIVVALLLTFLIQTFLAKVYVIPSGSMETTLHGCTGCNNDRVLVDKITYRFSAPQRGDVVVFRGPDSWSSEVTVDPPSNWVAAGLQQLGSLIGIAPPDEKDFVKRVIGVGGDVVQCCDTRNRVMVNGQAIDEPYVYYLPEAGPPRQDPFGPITVPDGQLWMMGDSRNNSSDSRVPGHGPIPVDNVIGKARLIVLPINRFGWITSFDPTKTTAVGLAPGAGPPLALGALFVVPLMRRRRTTLDRRTERLDGFAGFLPDRRRWR
jgi:signal peptidase I